MKPSINTLAMRDPALAVLVGGLAPKGSDFGVEFGGYAPEFGEDAPTPENMQRAWLEKRATAQREALLEPNKYSSAKIQRYAFGITQTLTLSTAVALSLSGQPETNIRPQRITCNAPLPAFATLTSIKVANVGVLVGGSVDAYDFSADGVDQALDVPTITPANTVKAIGAYSGLLPSGGYVTATSYIFVMSFKGPASMVG